MQTKSIFMSKAFWGAVIAVVALLFPNLFMQLHIVSTDPALPDRIMGAIGVAVGFYGRMKATHALSLFGR
jgi:hypothetical protein